ncbi:MAG: hypothetical protein AAF511_05760 [Pseudomonadota bacterium]
MSSILGDSMISRKASEMMSDEVGGFYGDEMKPDEPKVDNRSLKEKAADFGKALLGFAKETLKQIFTLGTINIARAIIASNAQAAEAMVTNAALKKADEEAMMNPDERIFVKQKPGEEANQIASGTNNDTTTATPKPTEFDKAVERDNADMNEVRAFLKTEANDDFVADEDMITDDDTGIVDNFPENYVGKSNVGKSDDINLFKENINSGYLDDQTLLDDIVNDMVTDNGDDDLTKQ